jgi:hypothetical protein
MDIHMYYALAMLKTMQKWQPLLDQQSTWASIWPENQARK